MTTITLSTEQQAVVNAALTGSLNIACVAAAGSGKTTLLLETVKALVARGVPRTKILVIAFNRTISDEFCTRLEEADPKVFARIMKKYDDGTEHIDRRKDVAITFDSLFPYLDGRQWFIPVDPDDRRGKKAPPACFNFANVAMKDHVWEQAGKRANADTSVDWFVPDRMPDELEAVEDASGKDSPDRVRSQFGKMTEVYEALCVRGIDPETCTEDVVRDMKRGSELWADTGTLVRLFKAFGSVCRTLGMWTLGMATLRLLTAVRAGGNTYSQLRSEFSKYKFVIIDEAQDNSFVQNEIVQALCRTATRSGPRLLMVGDPRQCIYEWRGASPEQLGEFAAREDTLRFDLTINRRSLPAIVAAGNDVIREYAYGPDCAAHRSGNAEIAGVNEELLWTRCLQAIRQIAGKGRSIAVLTYTNADMRMYSGGLLASEVPHKLGAGKVIGLSDIRLACARLEKRYLTNKEENNQTARVLAGVARRKGLDADGLKRWIDQYLEACDTADVHVMTIHKSKGREWHTVFVNSSRALTASSWQDTTARLQYVARTRAMDGLVLFYFEALKPKDAPKWKGSSVSHVFDIRE